MKILGKETIHPLLFYSGKIIGYLLWILCILAFSNVIDLKMIPMHWLSYIAYISIGLGLIFITCSFISLGKSTRLGLPTDDTTFKDNGIYKYSRNPMYVGFNLFTISSILINSNALILLLGIYVIYIYHLIIKGEETFLEKRFGSTYLRYKSRVRRYI